ncbi:MAG TPA: DUF5597 domain-containing protein [Anaerolineae bacterium]|nr:DUF5597 domain-containing protein [Anaerolineae bacterium]
MSNLCRVFTVGGKPFFSLGGQSRNSSGYNDGESETAFKAVKLLHGNTLEIPVYWEQVEPEEGVFDFASVDALLASARRYGVKLVLLWFGTWKNGNMEYAPAWVKTDPKRFKRVLSPTGKDVWVLSSHCQATLEADKSAFTALCRHLKANDRVERTVISLQIENEPGILGSDRDYGPEGQAAFEGAVPAELVSKIKAAGKGRVYDLWQEAGGKESGTWPELFGWSAGELISAWSIATYIDRLAEAGKAIYDIPMYINVWLGEQGWRVAGESYPSGGAVGKTLDIYKWFTPHVDLIAPDIYIADAQGYDNICSIYARDDNPLFVPESAPWGSNAWNMFHAIADYDAIGYHFFAVETIVAEDGSVRPGFETLVGSYRSVAAAIPLLLEYQGSGKIHAVVQEENMAAQTLDLDGYTGIAQFGAGRMPFVGKDWRHPLKRFPLAVQPEEERGRGLVIQVSKHEFYLIGGGYRLFLRPKTSPERALDASLARDHLLARLANYVLVDEGHFDENGEFVVDRRRNGDETDHGVWVETDVGVVHVVLCD